MQETSLREFARKLELAKRDPVDFAETFLDFHPYEYQEEFLRDDSPRIAAVCGRQVGKTTMAAIKALHYAFFNPNVTVLIVSASLRQSMILFEKIRLLTYACLISRIKLLSETRTTLHFDHGSKIIALPCGRTGFSLRGFTANMTILDEANFMPADVIDSVIRPMLITQQDSKLILLSTPWSRDHPFHESCTRPELGFKVYSWPTSLNPSVTRESLEAERLAIGEQRYMREYEGMFVDEDNTYFPSSLILGCTDGELEPYDDHVPTRRIQGTFYLGVDFGKKVDCSVVAVVALEDTQLRLIHLHRFPLETAYASVIGYVKALTERFQTITRVLCDQTGVGEYIVEDMRAGGIMNVEGVKLTLPRKEEILGYLKQRMIEKRLAIPYDRELIAEMNEQRFEMTKDGHLRFSHPENAHDDRLWALALAAYASRETPLLRYKPFTRVVDW